MTAPYDFTGAPCIGRAMTFESTKPADHVIAREMCRICPHRTPCADLFAEVHAIADAGGTPGGTWAGRLYNHKGKQEIGPAEERDLIEETMFTMDEARAAHRAWNAGDRSDRARIGERVYQRQARRDQQRRRGVVA